MNIFLDILKFFGAMLPLGLPIALVIFFFVKSSKMKREKEERARIRTEENIAQKARRKEEQQQWSSRNTDYTKLANMLCVKNYLYSDRGIDYSQLRDLLAAKQFEEANNLTILHIWSATKGSSFYDSIPYLDLVTIDRLWSQFSEGRFGFGVQVQLWQQGNKSRAHLECELGWHESVCIKKYIDEKRCVYHEFSHDYGALERWLQSEAPKGHLPNLFFRKWYPEKGGRDRNRRGGAMPTEARGKIIYTRKVTEILDDWGSGGNAPIDVEKEEVVYEEIDAFSEFMNRVEKALDQAV
jgi:hypothetical protein